MNIRTKLLCTATLAAISLASPAQAKTFILPHVLETSGSISFTLPGSTTIQLRESPSKASLGKVTFVNESVPGEYRIHSFFDIFTELSYDGGQTWTPDAGTFSSESRLPPSAMDNGGLFDTEMLSMELRESPTKISTGQTLLRESPTLASLGKGHVTVLKNANCQSGVCSDGYSVDSFFDVFTEISIDGGTTWIASDNSVRMNMATSAVPVPAAAWLLGSGLLGLIGVARRKTA